MNVVDYSINSSCVIETKGKKKEWSEREKKGIENSPKSLERSKNSDKVSNLVLASKRIKN